MNTMKCLSVRILGCKHLQITLFMKQKGSSLQGSWGLEESTGRCRTRLWEWAGMCVCWGVIVVGARHLELSIEIELTSVFANLS